MTRVTPHKTKIKARVGRRGGKQLLLLLLVVVFRAQSTTRGYFMGEADSQEETDRDRRGQTDRMPS